MEAAVANYKGENDAETPMGIAQLCSHLFLFSTILRCFVLETVSANSLVYFDRCALDIIRTSGMNQTMVLPRSY